MKKCGIWCIQTVSQAYYVEILKLLRESVRKKRPELWPSYLVTMPQLKRHCLSASLAQTSMTELEHPPCSPGLAPNDLWLFPKIKSALKGRSFHDIEDIRKYDSTESYSTKRVPKMFPTVAASLG
jgi:histone-lysine N-methyltransferase SETMAR